MNITKTVSSEKLVRNGSLELTLMYSPEGLYKKTKLNLEDDPRLEKLLNAVEAEIKKHGWIPEKNEKEISEKTVSLMHNPKFYGEYDKGILDAQKKIYSGSSLNTDEISSFAAGVTRNNKTENLKEFNKGELICKQQAAIASYVLHKIGLPNDYCAGNGVDSLASGHAFVQLASGNIVEATVPKNSFMKTENNARISAGEVVIVRDSEGAKHTYGGGKMTGIEPLAYTFSPNKPSLLISEVRENTVAALAKHDPSFLRTMQELKLASALSESGVQENGKDTPDKPQQHTSAPQVEKQR